MTIQAQILQLIKELQAEFGMALIMITHDLGVVAETVDRVVVMYNGEVMEQGPVAQIFEAPSHPYTKKLLASLQQPPAQQTSEDAELAPALELRGLSKTFTFKRRTGWWNKLVDFPAVRDIDLVVPRNSHRGAGRRIRLRQVDDGALAMRLLEPTSGQIIVDGQDISRP